MALHGASVSRGLSGYQIPHLDSVALKICVFVQAPEGPAPAELKMLWIFYFKSISLYFSHVKFRSTTLSPRLPLKSMVRSQDLLGTTYSSFLDTQDKMSHTSKGAGLSPLTTEKVKMFSSYLVNEINSTHRVYIRHFDLKKTYTMCDLCIVLLKV